MSANNMREIDLKDLLFQLLFRWRSVLIAGLAVFFILGGWKYYKAESKRLAYEKAVENVGDASAVLGSAVENLKSELQKNRRQIRALEVKITGKESEITTAQGKINSNQDKLLGYKQNKYGIQMKLTETEKMLQELESYISSSLLMKIDPSAKPVAKRTYQIISEDAAGINSGLYRDPADEIVSAYRLGTENRNSLKELSESNGMEVKYFQELFSVSENTLSNTVTVEATGLDRQMALAVLNAVCTSLEKQKDEIASRYQEHALKKVSDFCEVIIDNNLLTVQNNIRNQRLDYITDADSARAELAGLETGLINTQAEIEALEAKIGDLRDDISEMEEDIAGLEKTGAGMEASMKATVPTAAAGRKAALKYALIGLFVGMAAALGFHGIVYLLNGRMHTAEEVSHYFRLPILAVLPKELRGKQNLVDRVLNRLEGGSTAARTEDVFRTVSLTAGVLTVNMKSVVLPGAEKTELLKQTAEELQKRAETVSFLPVSERFVSPDDLDRLRGCDAVILCVVRNRTKISVITEECSRAQLFGKKILGFIVA